MTVKRTATNETCKLCGFQIINVHMKNTYIDDYQEECSNQNCSDYDTAERRLTASARREARRENE